MAKPKIVNPCLMKGRYLGRRSAGRIYQSANLARHIIPSGCECSVSFRNFASQESDYLSEKSNYALDKKSTTPETDFIRLAKGAACPSNSFIALPCQKSFLNPDSEGTKVYQNLKRRQNQKTGFTGCYSVDEGLLEENAINYDLKESLGKYNDLLNSLEISDYDEEIRDLNWSVVLPKFSRADSILGVGCLITFNKILETLVQDSDLSGNRGGQSLDAEMLFLEASESDDLAKLKSRKLLKAFKKMTKLQRQTVKAVYLKNFHDKTKVEIAESLGISIDTLKDRLRLAFAKVAFEFKDLFPKYDPELERKKSENWRPASVPDLPLPIKHTRRDGSVVIMIPTRGNAEPFGPIRERVGIDREAIRRKIRMLYFG